MAIQQLIIDEAGEGITTDGVETPIYSVVIPPESSGYFRSIVCARRVSDGAAKQFTIDVGFRRNASGNVVITSSNVSNYGTLNLDAYPGVASDSMQIQVLGLVAQSVEWSCVSRGICLVHVP